MLTKWHPCFIKILHILINKAKDIVQTLASRITDNQALTLKKVIKESQNIRFTMFDIFFGILCGFILPHKGSEDWQDIIPVIFTKALSQFRIWDTVILLHLYYFFQLSVKSLYVYNKIFNNFCNGTEIWPKYYIKHLKSNPNLVFSLNRFNILLYQLM